MPELYGTLSATGVLNGTLQTIVYADNYNNLTNKPAINGHTLQGDQTASDLGLLTLADVPVESVNGQTGTVVLDGADIPYAAGVSVNDKIDAVEASIPSVPVLSVNGQTGTVVLDGADIEYGAGISVNDQIDNVAAQIPSIPVESVNGQTGVVDLDGSDINYNASTTINQRLDILYNAIPDVPVQSVNNKIGNVVLDGSDISYNASYTVNGRIDYVEGLIAAGDVVSVNGQTGVVVLEGSDIEYSVGVTVNDQIGTNTADIGTNATAIGDLSQLTTTDKSSLVGAVNEVDEFISHLSNKYVIGGTKAASGITRVDFGVTFSSPPVVSVIPLNSTSPQTYLRTCALVTLTSTYFEFVEIAIQNGSTTLINGTDNCVWIAAGNKA